ncbi:5-formyltetrahydrofolate cyclo-ligase [Ammoniphilus sp. CFH 90114]|uniref:5-formyltetrahydrofolate cyclo-ligase n=1 Tax=Ammoniphilus sp. CFH 90114 TaxID=2493665 RepID=UPI0013E98EF6|nr:5-formyltetrahydrofolate cyclo-ligase [Ammoniphilus sp. CFH 90114]
MSKKWLRKQILSKRSQIESSIRKKKSEQIVRQILDNQSYKEAKTLFSFVPFGDEVDIRELLSTALQEGKEVVIPKTFVEKKEMVPYLFRGWETLVPGIYGILEPDPEISPTANLEKIDLIIMPGVAFDHNGGRLGYGGGYYDRFLSKLPKLPRMIAPCFVEQIVESIPMDDHDFRMETIVTDEGWIDCINSF